MDIGNGGEKVVENRDTEREVWEDKRIKIEGGYRSE